nr:hypothetical protein [Sulfurimonas sp. SAG-AH-194-I05]
MNFENYLHDIDESFKEKSQKDIYMTYIMIFSMIFAFAYLLFWETAEADFNETRGKVMSVQTNIDNDKKYLQYNPSLKITTLENDIKKIQSQIISYKDNNQYIKNKIEEISSLVYNEKTWGKYLHSISKNAFANHVKILNLTNTYSKTNATFGHILDINIQTEAPYINTIQFINTLEQSDLVVDLHSFNIEAKETLISDFNLSVWGITY